MHQRQFTLGELSQCNGQNGAPAFVAYEGIVYDVSSSFLWRNGRHQVLHEAGTLFDRSLAQAPHGVELLYRFPVMGILVAEKPPG